MDVSAEAADVVVREGLQATEATVKLTAECMTNVAALLMAIARQDFKVVGETTSKRLARDPAPAVVVPVKAEDRAKFQELAKEFGVLYFIAQKKGNDSGILNVVSNQNYAAQLNAVMEQMGYPIPQKEQAEETQKKTNPHAQQEKCSKERVSGSNHSRATAEPVEKESPTKKRLEQLQMLAEQTRQKPVKNNRKVR
jgi:hypothetical protein